MAAKRWREIVPPKDLCCSRQYSFWGWSHCFKWSFCSLLLHLGSFDIRTVVHLTNPLHGFSTLGLILRSPKGFCLCKTGSQSQVSVPKTAAAPSCTHDEILIAERPFNTYSPCLGFQKLQWKKNSLDESYNLRQLMRRTNTTWRNHLYDEICFWRLQREIYNYLLVFALSPVG